jgi:sugar transferase EpsL
VKRIIDCVGSFIALLIISPVICITAILILKKIGKPILFRQERPGLNGKPFHVYKFRSMTDERDIDGNLLPDEIRLTKVGVIIRKFSLDELPQLWNVFKGDMSFVGPRPLLMEYLSLYSERQAKRHRVLPGITGWAQVNGRNNITWEKKFELDVWYVENQSFLLDLNILLLTIKKVFQRDGVNKDGNATSDTFKGNL